MIFNSIEEVFGKLQNNEILIVTEEHKKYIISYYQKKSMLRKFRLFSQEEILNQIYCNSINDLINIRDIYCVEKGIKFNVDYGKNLLKFLYELDENKISGYYSDYKKKYITKSKNRFDNIETYFINVNSTLKNNVHGKEIKIKGSKKIKVLQYNDTNIEIAMCCEKINKLIQTGIDIDNIFVYSGVDHSLLKSVFAMYNYHIDDDYNKFLYEKDYIKQIINELEITSDIENYVNKKLDSISDKDISYFNEVVEILNKYVDYFDDFGSIREFVMYELKNKKLNALKLSTTIKVIKEIYPISSNDYLFVIGANQNQLPKFSNESNFNSKNDSIKMNIQTTNERNKCIADTFTNNLTMNENTYISYTKNDTKKITRQLMEFDIVEKKETITNENISYILYKKLDYQLKNFNISSRYHAELETSLNIQEYVENRFDIEPSIETLYNKTLSSSSISEYNKCGFAFYLNRILKVGEFKNTFAAWTGTYIHKVLELMYLGCNDPFSDESLKIMISEYNEKDKNKLSYFVSKINSCMGDLIEYLNEVDDNSKLKVDGLELKHEWTMKADHSVNLTAVIDKVLKKGNDYIIIDYKKGDSKIDSLLFEFGLELQNIIYMIAIRDINPDSNFIGTYRQRVSPKIYNYLDKKESDNYKYSGISVNDIDKLKLIGNSLDLMPIKGVKATKSGIAKNKNIIAKSEIEQLIENTEKILIDTAHNIRGNNFPITDKRYSNRMLSCEYCDFKDVCLKKNENIVILKTKEQNA